MEWEEKDEVKLGDYGEQLVVNTLNEKGICYAATKGPHLIDLMYITNKGKTFAIDVKTKQRLIKYKWTGYDLKDHKKYLKLSEKIATLVIFVDRKSGKIYGQDVKVLDQHIQRMKGKESEPVVYFPLDIMRPIRDLTPIEISKLYELDNSNYK